MKNPFKSIANAYVWLTHKRHISIVDEQTNRWHVHLSPMTLFAATTAIVALIFGILLLLVAYTPLLDHLPGYRTDTGRSREALVKNLIRLDSLERKVNNMLVYNESRILVVDGKTPAMRTVQSDSLRRNKDIVAPSHIDSLLRERMEHDPQYMLNSGSSAPRSKISASTPMQGLIAERFDARNGLYGVRISGKREAQVMAIADGIVLADDWSPESGSTLIIQHNDSTISVYRHLQSTLPAKGQRVRGSQVIGYAAAQDENSELSMLEFELWGEGKPLNPEMYIIF